MNTFSCQCYTSGASDRFAAQKRLDDLVTGPWYTNSKEKEDAACIRHHIKILKATNAFDVAELLDIAHCCTTLHPDASSTATDNRGMALAEALIHDTRHRLSSMERLAARIRERNGQVKKLEHHLKVYGMILKSLDVVLPGDGTTYSYKIDSRNGISLIIQAADNSDTKSQVSSENTDLVDLAIVPCISTPVLKPVCISPPTQAPTALAAEQDAQDVKREEPAEWVAQDVETKLITRASPEKQITTNSAKEEPPSTKRAAPALPQGKPKAPILQIWDSEEEHSSALQEYTIRGYLHPESAPQVFQHGIQYHPTAPLNPTSRSRMVVFAGLHPSTTLSSLLDRVRGGPVLRAVRADRSTALVSFVHARDAHAYVAHVAPRIRGRTPRVSLADSPSYPVRGALLRDIAERGVTRVLAISCADAAFRGALEGFFAWKGLWAFTETRGLRCENGGGGGVGGGDGEDVAREGGSASEATDEWTAVSDKISNAAEQRMLGLPTPTTAVYSVSFRDVQHARNAYFQIRAVFPRCGVHYAPDRCAGPLDELDGWDMLA